jgi:hypothetical protein
MFSNLEESSLIGTWELRSLDGAQVPNAQTTFAPGNGNRVIFTQNNVAFYNSDTLVREEQYSLVMDTCWAVPSPPKMLPRFVIPNEIHGSGVFLEVDGKKLTIYRHLIAADGYIETYARVNEGR